MLTMLKLASIRKTNTAANHHCVSSEATIPCVAQGLCTYVLAAFMHVLNNNSDLACPFFFRGWLVWHGSSRQFEVNRRRRLHHCFT